jgi:ABC-type amino acid transport substrate-binding protein
MAFTEPWTEGFEAAVAPVDGEVKTLEDFKGKVIGTETGTSQAAWLASMQKEYGPFEIRGYEDRETQYLDMEAGRIQALTTGYNTAVAYLKDKPQYHIIATSKENFMIGCAVRTGDPLKEEFDKALHEMKEDGTTEELFVKYFGEKPPAGSAVTRIFTEPYVADK